MRNLPCQKEWDNLEKLEKEAEKRGAKIEKLVLEKERLIHSLNKLTYEKDMREEANPKPSMFEKYATVKEILEFADWEELRQRTVRVSIEIDILESEEAKQMAVGMRSLFEAFKKHYGEDATLLWDPDNKIAEICGDKYAG